MLLFRWYKTNCTFAQTSNPLGYICKNNARGSGRFWVIPLLGTVEELQESDMQWWARECCCAPAERLPSWPNPFSLTSLQPRNQLPDPASFGFNAPLFLACILGARHCSSLPIGFHSQLSEHITNISTCRTFVEVWSSLYLNEEHLGKTTGAPSPLL